MLTLGILQALWPKGDSVVAGLMEGIIARAPVVFPKYGLTDDLTIAHFFAQASHECGAGTEMVENLNYSAEGLVKTWPTRFDAAKAVQLAHQPQLIANTVYNGRMGNRIGTDDGWNFRGRGLSQCTGRDGYSTLGQSIGLDLIDHPELVNAPLNALECGVADFVICGCLQPAKDDDIEQVTKHLNGGLIGLAQREAWLAKFKAAFETGTEAT